MAQTLIEWLKGHWSRLIAILDHVHKRIATSLDAARRKRKGTKLAIVGPQAAGKTVVHVFLATGALIREYMPTLGVVRKDPNRVEIAAIEQAYYKEPIRLYLAETLDVGGDFKAFPDAWNRVLGDAFFVLFLFDMNKFIGDHPAAVAYRRLVVDGCDFAGGLIANSDTKVVLAGTHCDLIPGWNLTTLVMNDIGRMFWKYREAEDARNHLAKNTKADALVTWGSLDDEKSATSLLYSIFESGS